MIPSHLKNIFQCKQILTKWKGWIYYDKNIFLILHYIILSSTYLSIISCFCCAVKNNSDSNYIKKNSSRENISILKMISFEHIMLEGADEANVLNIFFKFYFIFKLYIIVLVLPNIKMNPPQVYMCSHPEPSSFLPPHTIPLGRPSALAPSIQ